MAVLVYVEMRPRQRISIGFCVTQLAVEKEGERAIATHGPTKRFLILLPLHLFFHFLFTLSLSLPVAKGMSLDLEEETPSGSSTSVAEDGKLVPMDLLDEYWFFHNTLNTSKARPPHSPNKGKESGAGTSIQQRARLVSRPEKPSEDSQIAPRDPLLATPSPMLRRVGPDEAGREEVAVPSESRKPKLRHSCSSLDDHHRPQYSSSKVKEQASPFCLGLHFVWLVLGTESDASYHPSLHLPVMSNSPLT